MQIALKTATVENTAAVAYAAAAYAATKDVTATGARKTRWWGTRGGRRLTLLMLRSESAQHGRLEMLLFMLLWLLHNATPNAGQ